MLWEILVQDVKQLLPNFRFHIYELKGGLNHVKFIFFLVFFLGAVGSWYWSPSAKPLCLRADWYACFVSRNLYYSVERKPGRKNQSRVRCHNVELRRSRDLCASMALLTNQGQRSLTTHTSSCTALTDLH